MSTWMMVREEGAGPTAGLRRWSAETDAGSHRGQCGDHEADVLVEAHAPLFRSAVPVVKIHGAGETLVLELLLDRCRLEPGDGAAGAHEGAGGDEARQLVARVETSVQQGHARESRVVRMGEDGVDDLRRGAAGDEYLGTLHGMVRGRGVHLVVEVVEHARHPPRLGIGAVTAGGGTHGRFHGQRVLAETVGLREFGEEGPGPRPVHDAPVRVRHLSIDFLENSHWPSCSIAGMRRSTARSLRASASMERYVEASLTVMVSLGITCARPPLEL